MSRPRLTPDDLAVGSHFTLLGEMRNSAMLDFVVEYFLRRRTWLIWVHHAMSLATLVTGLTVAFSNDAGVWFNAGRALAAFAGAFVLLAVVILPLHEIVHALAYLLIGARDIRWGFSPRMAAVWVTAHRFVAGRAEYVFVALAPFALNAALIAGAIAFPGWRLILIFLLLWHLHGASGDWALMNFVWIHRKLGVWTYDDCDAGVSYFYGRAPSASDTAESPLP